MEGEQPQNQPQQAAPVDDAAIANELAQAQAVVAQANQAAAQANQALQNLQQQHGVAPAQPAEQQQQQRENELRAARARRKEWAEVIRNVP